jgi:hypothetical protein
VLTSCDHLHDRSACSVRFVFFFVTCPGVELAEAIALNSPEFPRSPEERVGVQMGFGGERQDGKRTNIYRANLSVGLRSGDPRHGRQRGSTRGQVQKLSARKCHRWMTYELKRHRRMQTMRATTRAWSRWHLCEEVTPSTKRKYGIIAMASQESARSTHEITHER